MAAGRWGRCHSLRYRSSGGVSLPCACMRVLITMSPYVETVAPICAQRACVCVRLASTERGHRPRHAARRISSEED